jgi:hypothetical protein
MVMEKVTMSYGMGGVSLLTKGGLAATNAMSGVLGELGWRLESLFLGQVLGPSPDAISMYD